MQSLSPGHTIGASFIELQTVDSTNNYALGQIHAGLAEHGQAIFAHEQVAGKGQRGKRWDSHKGQNIAISLLLRPLEVTLGQQFRLSACIAASGCELLERYAGTDVRIKWPNDLYWQDRKAGGILIESVVKAGTQGSSHWEWAVAGTGINVNQEFFSSDLPNPVSLKMITGKTLSTVALAKEYCQIVDRNWQLLTGGRFDELFSWYLGHLYKKDQPVRFRKENRVFEAIVRTVLPDGRLLVQHSVEEALDFGSVQWLLPGSSQ